MTKEQQYSQKSNDPLFAEKGAKYVKFFFYIIILIIAYIGYGYQYQVQEQSTAKLLKEFQSIHTRNLFLSAERINRERLEQIEDQVASLQLPLVRSTEPPFLVVDTLNQEDGK